jgi:DNA polymerase III epsilon subunit-like protein
MKILVVDLETTGFYQNSDAIVEIGIALVDTVTKTVELVFDKVVKHRKFNARRHKDAWIFQNTTLTVEDVENARPLEDYTQEIQGLFDKYKMTAYNKSFDIRFLTAAGFTMVDIKCLMKTATQYSTYKDKNGKIKKPSVEEIYNQFFMKDGEIYVEEHRAGADALDEAKILLHMVDIKSSGVLIFEDTPIKTKTINKTKTTPKKYKPMGLGDKFTFGKHTGRTFSEVLLTDKGYITWCVNKLAGFEMDSEAKKIFYKKRLVKQ